RARVEQRETGMSAGSVDLRAREARGDASAASAPGAAGSAQWNAPPSSELRPLPFVVSPPLIAASARQAEAASRSGIALRVCDDPAEVEGGWGGLAQHPNPPVFKSFDCLAPWRRHMGPRQGTIPAVVLGYDRDGLTLFILPLATSARGPLRRLTWLGAELCDYNAPLLGRRFSDRMSAGRFTQAWHDVVELLGAAPQLPFDLVDLQERPETIGGQRNPLLDLEVFAHASGAYVADLGSDWDAFYAAKRSSATRKRERRQLKHLAEHGEIRFVEGDIPDQAAAIMATLMSQKSRAFARMGVEDFLARPGYREFFLAAATEPGLSDVVHVSRLDVGAIAAATSFGLKFRNCYYLILSSYDDGELSRFGPGRAHLYELLRHAIACGFRHFDFTVGDEPYKRDWCDGELRLYDHLAAGSLRGAIVLAMTLAFRRTKRFIKQSQIWWPVFSEARALAGLLR